MASEEDGNRKNEEPQASENTKQKIMFPVVPMPVLIYAGNPNSHTLILGSPRNQTRSKAPTHEGCPRCRCKKTRCLKLYCSCFAAEEYCTEECACEGCRNRREFDDEIRDAKQKIVKLDEHAFRSKFELVPADRNKENTDGNRNSLELGKHKRGCNCRKTRCNKKYCDCFQAGVGCSENCRCIQCNNFYGKRKGPADNERNEQLQMITTTEREEPDNNDDGNKQLQMTTSTERNDNSEQSTSNYLPYRVRDFSPATSYTNFYAGIRKTVTIAAQRPVMDYGGLFTNQRRLRSPPFPNINWGKIIVGEQERQQQQQQRQLPFGTSSQLQIGSNNNNDDDDKKQNNNLDFGGRTSESEQMQGTIPTNNTTPLADVAGDNGTMTVRDPNSVGAHGDITHSNISRAVNIERSSSQGQRFQCCNCKKSECLKPRCSCFASVEYCSEGCKCKGCRNRREFDNESSNAVQKIVKQDPSSKLELHPKRNEENCDGDRNSLEMGKHKKGCNCRKSRCNKGNCECFQAAGVGSSESCSCKECNNFHGKREEPGDNNDDGNNEQLQMINTAERSESNEFTNSGGGCGNVMMEPTYTNNNGARDMPGFSPFTSYDLSDRMRYYRRNNDHGKREGSAGYREMLLDMTNRHNNEIDRILLDIGLAEQRRGPQSPCEMIVVPIIDRGKRDLREQERQNQQLPCNNNQNNSLDSGGRTSETEQMQRTVLMNTTIPPADVASDNGTMPVRDPNSAGASGDITHDNGNHSVNVTRSSSEGQESSSPSSSRVT